MDSKKSYIPIKVFVSYLLLAGLFISVGWFLYNENLIFSETENKITTENNKILKVSNLLSNVYKTESLARITIQSNNEKDYKNYISKTDSLKLEIDSLKSFVKTKYQTVLLDSVKYLLSKKTYNIQQLKILKNKSNEEAAVKNAIKDISKIEGSLQKYRLKDMVKNPELMGDYQRSVLEKYVAYINNNIPDDSTNTLTNKASDSILKAYKTLLIDVKKATSERRVVLNYQENKLLENELLTSEQLRKILNIIEREIIITTTKNNSEKELALKNTNKIVTTAAIIAFLLTLFFSVLILNDFSKSQSYKKQLEIASAKTRSLLKNREQLIATVSHDLKTPLSTIVGYTELLNNSDLDKKQLYFTKNIKGSSEYIAQLVQDLLDFTQIEAGKIAIDSIPFSLSSVLNEVAKSIQAVYEQKPIDLTINIDKYFDNKIIGDPFRLRQILTNIIGNAFKFTAAGFIKIEANCDIENALLTITIEDSGIGIEEKNHQLVFEEFTQADENIEKKYGGTGLGLTISKKMVAILGGQLSLKSAISKGSIFEIQLPLLLDTSPTQNDIYIADSDKKRTVIVVDDDNNLLNLTTEVLRQNNFEVHSFSKAAEAIETMKVHHFDFVITDIQMPDIDGFQFLYTIKKELENFDNKPVFALTGRGDLDLDSYKKAGFTAVIKKPYSPKNLIETINAVLNGTPVDTVLNPELENVSTSKLYALDSLKSFLPNEDQALKNVLSSFIATTEENLALLDKAVAQNNVAEIKETAHRMCPMFKQIKANKVSTILDNLELVDFSNDELAANLETLKNQIALLFAQLEKEPF